jgi:cell division protein ZapA
MKSLFNDRVRVKIYGHEYEMDTGGLTPLEVQSLAAFVDDRMHEIANNSSIVDTQKVAVLAAINIALDYLQLKEKGHIKGNATTEQLEQMDAVLAEALNQPVSDTLL